MKAKTFNAEKMGQSNKRIVLNMIRYYPGISRCDLASTIDLDPSTVTKIIRDLKEKGWVEEVGRAQHVQPGRPAIKLETVSDNAVALVIEIAVERTCMTLGYLNNTIDEKKFVCFPTPQDKSVDLYFETLAKHVAESFRPDELAKVNYISVSVPGMIEKNSNILRNVPHMQWLNVDLEKELRSHMHWMKKKTPAVIAVNEGKLALATEKALNDNLKGMTSGIYLFITHGLAGALMCAEEVYNGTNNIAGEFGHMIVCPGGRKCYCGKEGCLEGYISLEAIVDSYEEHNAPLDGDYRDRFTAVMELAANGDKGANAVLDEIAEYMVVGIVNIATFYDPDFVMIGGMGYLLPDSFIEKVSQRVYKMLLVPLEGKLKILKGSMDIDTLTLRGAVMTAMDEFVNKSFSD